MKCTDIGKRLKSARELQGLSARKVSAMAELSLEAAHSIETTGRMPALDTCERLARVVRVSPSWLAYGAEPVRRIFNYRKAPGFTGLRRAADLDATLRGEGGRIDHSFLYSDPLGAARYIDLVRSARVMPVREAADAILQHGSIPMAVIALGAGNAQQESALASALANAKIPADVDGEASIELFLVDSSISLLSEGYELATEQLASFSIPICAIEGDFNRLPTFSDMFSARGPRRKVFTLLGYTVGNLDNELTFLRDCLICANRGDLLLIDAVLRHDEERDVQASLKHDPMAKILAAGGTVKTNRLVSFLAGPVARHYGEDSLKVGIRAVSDSGVIPNSYSVEFWVSIETPEGSKQFVTAGWRRYQIKPLCAAFERLGWKAVEKWSFNPERPSTLVLFQRQ